MSFWERLARRLRRRIHTRHGMYACVGNLMFLHVSCLRNVKRFCIHTIIHASSYIHVLWSMSSRGELFVKTCGSFICFCLARIGIACCCNKTHDELRPCRVSVTHKRNGRREMHSKQCLGTAGIWPGHNCSQNPNTVNQPIRNENTSRTWNFKNSRYQESREPGPKERKPCSS